MRGSARLQQLHSIDKQGAHACCGGSCHAQLPELPTCPNVLRRDTFPACTGASRASSLAAMPRCRSRRSLGSSCAWACAISCREGQAHASEQVRVKCSERRSQAGAGMHRQRTDVELSVAEGWASIESGAKLLAAGPGTSRVGALSVDHLQVEARHQPQQRRTCGARARSE